MFLFHTIVDQGKLAIIPDKRVTHTLRRAEVFLRQSYAKFASAFFFHVRYIM